VDYGADVSLAAIYQVTFKLIMWQEAKCNRQDLLLPSVRTWVERDDSWRLSTQEEVPETGFWFGKRAGKLFTPQMAY